MKHMEPRVYPLKKTHTLCSWVKTPPTCKFTSLQSKGRKGRVHNERTSCKQMISNKNKQIETIYKTKQKTMRLLYLSIYLKVGHHALTQNDTASPQFGSIEGDSIHKNGSTWGKWSVWWLGMSSLRVMVSQSTHTSIITAKGICHVVMGTSTLYL